MRRTEMMEIHDHPRFPAVLRDFVTDALEAMWEFGNSYRSILGVLREGLIASNGLRAGEAAVKVVDLCSGGGGPWMSLASQMEADYALALDVCLTDRYPNLEAFEKFRERAGAAGLCIRSSPRPVDATRVSEELEGFRTMFSAFHHFGPEQARAVLASASAGGRGIAVFEVASRRVKTLLTICVIPLLVLWLTPRMRPFRWARLFWTYVVPVIPAVIGYDGLVSCLRTYSVGELRELVEKLEGSRWQIGEARTGFLAVTYLVGVPAGLPE